MAETWRWIIESSVGTYYGPNGVWVWQPWEANLYVSEEVARLAQRHCCKGFKSYVRTFVHVSLHG